MARPVARKTFCQCSTTSPTAAGDARTRGVSAVDEVEGGRRVEEEEKGDGPSLPPPRVSQRVANSSRKVASSWAWLQMLENAVNSRCLSTRREWAGEGPVEVDERDDAFEVARLAAAPPGYMDWR